MRLPLLNGCLLYTSQADAFFESDIRAVENQVNALPLDLGQYQFCLLYTSGLTWLFTLRYTRKQAEADAMKSVQEVYQELIEDMKNDRKELKNCLLYTSDSFYRYAGSPRAR